MDVFFGDERCVPPDDPDSNYRMANETLLSLRAGARPPHARRDLRRRSRTSGSCAGCSTTSCPQLRPRVPRPWPEGHTASLFPGDPALDEKGALGRQRLAAGPRAHDADAAGAVVGAAGRLPGRRRGEERRAATHDGRRRHSGKPDRGAARVVVLADAAAASEVEQAA